MTRIIAFAGKKQSGKNTACNFIMAQQLYQAGICKEAALNQYGDIIVSDILGDKHPEFDMVPLTEEFVDAKTLFNNFQVCKTYALADALKRIAIDVLGLPENKVYGSDKDKNSKTHLRWENMSGVTTDLAVIPSKEIVAETSGRLGHYYDYVDSQIGRLVYHKPGKMSIREVLQYVGTEIFRKMYDTVWVDTLIRRIENDNPKVALVCDVRFENEMKLLKKNGAIIIGLLRNSKSRDKHASEQINFDLCDEVLDNSSMSIMEQSQAISQILDRK